MSRARSRDGPTRASRCCAAGCGCACGRRSRAIAIVVAGLAVGWRTASVAPIAMLAVVYACSGLIELLHYFYRGLSRSDVESSLTLWQRGGTLVCGAIALAWKPDVTVLAIAMLLPVARHAGGKRADRRYASQRAGLPPSPNVEVRLLVAGLPPRRLADRRRHRAVRAVFPDRCLPRAAVVGHRGGRASTTPCSGWSRRCGCSPRPCSPSRCPRSPAPAISGRSARSPFRSPRLRSPRPPSLWAAAGWLIPLVYGAPYAAAVPAFRILLLSFPLMSLNYALTHQLIGWDGQRAYAGVCAGALAVNVAHERAADSGLVDRGRRVGDAGDRVGPDRRLRAALWGLRAAAHTAPLVTEA